MEKYIVVFSLGFGKLSVEVEVPQSVGEFERNFEAIRLAESKIPSDLLDKATFLYTEWHH